VTNISFDSEIQPEMVPVMWIVLGPNFTFMTVPWCTCDPVTEHMDCDECRDEIFNRQIQNLIPYLLHINKQLLHLHKLLPRCSIEEK
jgi:hypothetical protein